jgi:hypothetical protein
LPIVSEQSQENGVSAPSFDGMKSCMNDWWSIELHTLAITIWLITDMLWLMQVSYKLIRQRSSSSPFWSSRLIFLYIGSMKTCGKWSSPKLTVIRV